MKLLKLFLAVAIFATLVSCSKDEEFNPSQDDLIGNWQVTDISYEGSTVTEFSGIEVTYDFTGTGYDMNLNVDFSQDPNKFQVDGSYSIKLTTDMQGEEVVTDWINPEFLNSGTWELKKDKLIVVSMNEIEQEATITELNETVLKIRYEFVYSITQSGIETVQKVKGIYTFEKK